MPPRRPARGRHRKPRLFGHLPLRPGLQSYLTAAVLVAFAVSGLNLPGAIGDSRHGRATQTAPAGGAVALPVRAAVSAAELREMLARRHDARASRLRVADRQAAREALAAVKRAAKAAARKARKAAERARPKWVLPVRSYRLTAGFGDWGLWSSAHTGQDFAAPSGSAVRSVGDGRIVSAEYDGAYGNKIVVRHPDGTLSWYAHLSSFVLTSGRVQAGDLIGRVGSTGNSTGDHLHLEIRVTQKRPVPPLEWLRRHGARA